MDPNNFKYAPIFNSTEKDYTQCRNCFQFSFYIDTCENCYFQIKTPENKKLFIIPVEKMKYVEKLLKRYRTEIKPNHYVYGFKDYEHLCEKYKNFLAFLYVRNGRGNVRHHYFISKLINEQPKKTNAKLDKIWNEWLDKVNF